MEELAEEERPHIKLFTELSQHEDLTKQIHQQVDTPVSDSRFSDCFHLPDLHESLDDQSILQHASGREQAVMGQYQAFAEGAQAIKSSPQLYTFFYDGKPICHTV